MLAKEIPKQTLRPPKTDLTNFFQRLRYFVGASGIPFLWSLPWSCSFSPILAWAPWWTSFFLRERMWRPSDLPSPFQWWPCPEIVSKEAGQVKRTRCNSWGFRGCCSFPKGCYIIGFHPWCWKNKMGCYRLPGHIQQLEVCCFEEVLWRSVSWLWVEGWAVEDVVRSLWHLDTFMLIPCSWPNVALM